MTPTATAILQVLACFYLVVEGVHSLECYNCQNITDVKLCNTKQACGLAESCFVDKSHTGNMFNMGCLDNTKCSIKVSLGFGSVVGKRQVSRCHECCSADLCNIKLCDYSAATSCSDDPSIDCARMESLFSVCQNSQQAHDLCPRFCGLCRNDTQTTSSPTTAKYSQTTPDSSIVTTPNSCQDNQTNCEKYDDAACRGIFESWSRAHCARRCGYCDEITTSGGMQVNATNATPPQIHGPNNTGSVDVSSSTYTMTGVKSPVKGKCFFQNATFYEDEHWQDTCRYDCQCKDAETNTAMCTDVCPHYNSIPPSCTIQLKAGECCPKLDCGNGTNIIHFTNNVTTNWNGSACHDKINGCEYYEDIVCRGIYEPWARGHCALRCGYCGFSPPCVDKSPQCNAYDLRTACVTFPGWARVNCKKSCSLCN